MGVPVVTCPGETFASRHSLSHLSNVGLTETIARDLDEYVELAVSLAGDLPRLAVLRAGLRERMAASPLCDGKRFATNLASMLHDVWEQRAWTHGNDFLKHWRLRSNTIKPAGCKPPSRSTGRFSRSSRIMPMRCIFSA